MITDEQLQTVADVLNIPLSAILLRKALEAYEQSKWVNVVDRLPSDINYQELLVKRNGIDGTFLVASINKRWWNIESGCEYGKELTDITHWQPLPEFKE